MKFKSKAALVASAAIAIAGAFSCSNPEPTTIIQDEGSLQTVGSFRLALTVGGQTINTVTAVITGKNGFVTQTHMIDVTGESGVISIFFGDLPAQRGYTVELTAGACSGRSTFNVEADQTALVSVSLTCPGSGGETSTTGSAQVTGTIIPGSAPVCDHVTKMVAGPAVQNGNGPVASIELVLDEGVVADSIGWTQSSVNGGLGVFGALSGTKDREVTFDCSRNGTVVVIAAVTAPEGSASCTQQARVSIECVNQSTSGGVCGDGVINGTEQCDGMAGLGTCPPGTTGTVACTSTCTRDTSACLNPPPCGNGVLDANEQCDGALGVGTCPTGTTGTVTCTPQCTRNTSACMTPVLCGNGALDPGEQCDGATGVGTCPVGTTGTVTCTSTCTRNTSACVTTPAPCGNGALDANEECDGTLGVGTCPAGTTGTVTCSSQCTRNTSACTSAPTSGECQHSCVEDLENNGICSGIFADVTPASDPVIDCVFGTAWPAPNRFLPTTCVNGALTSCMCGSVPPASCFTTTNPALLTDAPCLDELIAATGCSAQPVTSQVNCVAQQFVNPSNPGGRAMAYAQCLQDNCSDICFTQ